MTTTTTSAPPRVASVFLGLALASVLVLAVVFGRAVWADNGSFALVFFGIFALCAGAALLVERKTHGVLGAVVVIALGVVSAAWSVLTFLGAGFPFMVPSALVMLGALFCLGQRVDGERSSRA